MLQLPKGYSLKRSVPIEELSLVFHEVAHETWATRFFFLQNKDQERAFSISLQTLPEDSTGLPHILEHLALCGSQKFPVKDPFFAMTRRSLATFMNAMTGDDFTCYPASTENPKDFFNLLSVYIDAVFFPTLDVRYFRQEGWRLEFEKPRDPSTPLTYRGIVFNEMKQHLSRPLSRLMMEMDRRLYKGSPYANESGGDPHHIPDLSYDQLKAFHERFYNPDGAILYFYGDIDIAKTLTLLESELFSQCTKKEGPPPALFIPPIEKADSPERVIYPATEQSAPFYLARGYRTAAHGDQKSRLALRLLDEIWMGHDGAPLKAALLDSNLFRDVDSMFDTERPICPYLFLLEPKKAEKMGEAAFLLDRLLLEMSKKSFSKEIIDRALHQLTFEIEEITRDPYPRGIDLFFRMLGAHHGEDPIHLLKMRADLTSLAKEAQSEGFFNNLIERFFIQNDQRRAVELFPDKELSSKEASIEKAKLEDFEKSLSKDAKEELIKQALELEALQKTPGESALLPTLALSDIGKRPRSYPLLDGHLRKTFTQGIVYFDLPIYFAPKNSEEAALLSLWLSFFSELGTKKTAARDRLEQISAAIGDLSCAFDLFVSANPEKGARPAILLQMSVIEEKVPTALALFEEQLLELNFDEIERLEELREQNAAKMERRLMSRPLAFATLDATASLSPAAALRKSMQGKPLLEMLRRFEGKGEELSCALKALHAKILAAPRSKMLICSKEPEKITLPEKFRADHFTPPWQSFPIAKESGSHKSSITQSQGGSHVFAIPTIHRSHPDAQKLWLAAELASELILHPLVREQGGAYGARAEFLRDDGILLLTSYADPHLSQTLTTFQKTAELLLERGISEQELFEAKLSYFQRVDKPIAPSKEALFSFSLAAKEMDDLFRQKEREAMLCASIEQIVQAVKAHWISHLSEALFVTYSGAPLLSKEKREVEELLKASLTS